MASFLLYGINFQKISLAAIGLQKEAHVGTCRQLIYSTGYVGKIHRIAVVHGNLHLRVLLKAFQLVVMYF